MSKRKRTEIKENIVIPVAKNVVPINNTISNIIIVGYYNGRYTLRTDNFAFALYVLKDGTMGISTKKVTKAAVSGAAFPSVDKLLLVCAEISEQGHYAYRMAENDFYVTLYKSCSKYKLDQFKYPFTLADKFEPIKTISKKNMASAVETYNHNIFKLSGEEIVDDCPVCKTLAASK